MTNWNSWKNIISLKSLNFNARMAILSFLFSNFSCRSFTFALKKVSPLTKIPPPLLIITLYFLQGDPFICDQFLWTHWQHWGYCVVCNHEKTAEVPSTNANAFCIWLILRYIEFHALRLTQSKSNFFIS